MYKYVGEVADGDIELSHGHGCVCCDCEKRV